MTITFVISPGNAYLGRRMREKGNNRLLFNIVRKEDRKMFLENDRLEDSVTSTLQFL